MQITYKKVPGKNWGIYFDDVTVKMRDKVLAFVRYNSAFMDAPHKALSSKASPFIQADAPGFLFIEFWSEGPNHYQYIREMAKECKFTIDLPFQTTILLKEYP